MVLLTVAVYVPAMRAGFVFDDVTLIRENRLVHAADGLSRFWLTTDAADYYPLTWSVWWLEWRLWGANPLGYHVLNVLWHAANAILVWRILRQLKIPGAWLAGLVFAVHPVNVATAAWISEQKNSLSMLFGLLATLLYLRFNEQGGWWRYGCSLAAFLLALLSKSAVVMLPVVLLGCVWWVNSRLRGKDLMRTLPFFILSLIAGLTTIWFQYHRAGNVVRKVGFAYRVMAAGGAPWFYLWKAVLPIDLTVIYPKWEIDPSRWTFYLPGAVLVVLLMWFWSKRRSWGKPWLFGLGYFLAMLFPVLGFFDQGFYRSSLVADHWQYYSIVGVIGLVVAAGSRLWQKHKRATITASVVMLIVLSIATWKRAGLYADDETLWRDNVAKNPRAWAAQLNLGVTLQQAGRVQEAMGYFEEAQRIEPDHAEVHNSWGVGFEQLGRIQEAADHLVRALQINPHYAEAHYNLGCLLQQTGNLGDAIAHYQQALRLKPDYPEAHNNLGSALQQTGDLGDAIAHYEQALRLKPDYPEAENNLGFALQETGKLDGAITHYLRAVRLKPDFADAHYNLGLALEQAGKIKQAMECYQQALAVEPGMVDAQKALARLRSLSQTRGTSDAGARPDTR